MSESELTIKIPKPKGKLNLPVLINFLQRHLVHLHEVYTLSNNIDITNIMLAQITKIESIIGQLKSC